MKKLLILGVVLGGMAAMTSCKKTFTCECEGLTSFETYEKEGKGKTASEACTDAQEKVLGLPIEVCVPK